jgi:hypothetical protein
LNGLGRPYGLLGIPHTPPRIPHTPLTGMTRAVSHADAACCFGTFVVKLAFDGTDGDRLYKFLVDFANDAQCKKQGVAPLLKKLIILVNVVKAMGDDKKEQETILQFILKEEADNIDILNIWYSLHLDFDAMSNRLTELEEKVKRGVMPEREYLNICKSMGTVYKYKAMGDKARVA